MCICEERRRGRKSRKGQQFTLKPRCSEAARIIQSMQLTRHSMCRTAGRRFPPSRKATLRKGQGTVLLLTALLLPCVCVYWREERQRGHEESEEHGDIIKKVQGAECCAIFFPSLSSVLHEETITIGSSHGQAPVCRFVLIVALQSSSW